jgi:hypothetical protein
MERDPLKRMADHLRELKAEHAATVERVATLAAEIERLESAASVVREYAPVGRLPYLDEDVPVLHADLKAKNLPLAAVEVLRNLDQGATTRELLDILIQAKRMDPAKATTNHINLLNALKRHPEWFKKEGKVWMFIDTQATFLDSEPLASPNGHRP